jgi:hypothetical protein
MKFKSEITQKQVIDIFNHKASTKKLNLYTCFAGTYEIWDRLGSEFNICIIPPQKVVLERKNDDTMTDLFNDIMNDRKDKTDKLAKKLNFKPSDHIPDPLYATDCVIHFDWYVNVSMEKYGDINNTLLSSIKFFYKKSDAELHYVFMFHNYLKSNGLVDALQLLNSLIDKHKDVTPEQIIKILS